MLLNFAAIKGIPNMTMPFNLGKYIIYRNRGLLVIYKGHICTHIVLYFVQQDLFYFNFTPLNYDSYHDMVLINH